ncbi:hypothetical protein DdX_07686 [Ditylenchus destructor]|uniref:Uncharacterized protein n=1 Tax=Ditylenchus destructor TaxID=166010 RepID=A0AAD4N7B7_9BILA|nr:hypothetical protein DdX_07686 [Ditylenchus destructor]
MAVAPYIEYREIHGATDTDSLTELSPDEGCTADKEHSPGETLTWGNVMDRNLPHFAGIRTVPTILANQ